MGCVAFGLWLGIRTRAGCKGCKAGSGPGAVAWDYLQAEQKGVGMWAEGCMSIESVVWLGVAWRAGSDLRGYGTGLGGRGAGGVGVKRVLNPVAWGLRQADGRGKRNYKSK